MTVVEPDRRERKGAMEVTDFALAQKVTPTAVVDRPRALGRALGETMAVTFVIGNANRIPTSLFSPGTSIAATLANEFGEADGLHISALFALGFLLFVITFIVLALAKWLIIRNERAKGL